MTTFQTVQALLDEAVAQGVFPSAQAAVIHRGETVFQGHAGEATLDTRFDLASLTKIICTTSLFMSAWARGKVGPNTLVSRFAPQSASGEAGVTFADLLFHRSGLPATVAYFARAMPAVPELFQPDCPPAVRGEVRAEVVAAAFRTGLRRPKGSEAVYSDVGFMQLGELLAQVEGQPLDALFQEKVAGPLGLDLAFRRLSTSQPDSRIAPTGQTRPREPAPGEENKWAHFPTHPSAPGEVDDDNAWVMDGVAGHAGLFGTAREVARFGQAVLEDFHGKGALAPSPLWHVALTKDAQTKDSTRAMGFDTPSANSSAGQVLGQHSPGAVGHLGFTGTSLWIDLHHSLSVALLTNRTARGRADVRIREFRPRFHDAVALALELNKS